MKRILLSIIVLQLSLPVLFCQDWDVPAEKKGKLSPFPFDEATRKEGEKLFTLNCMSCHGTPGKGNYLKLVPPPGDPATEKIQHNSDGEIFYKITEGRGQMPSFKSVLVSSEVWNIISYLRSFNSAYVQQVMPVITSSAYPGAEIILRLTYNSEDSTIILAAKAVKETSSVPVAGAGVKLFAQRTFGHLQIDEEKNTGTDGMAVFHIPGELAGDTAGNIRIHARFTNEEAFGSAIKDTVIQAGKKTFPVSLVAGRAMWNNVRKAPLWVILTYTIGVLTAWGFIMLVLMKLRDIFIIGDTLTRENTDGKTLKSE